MTASCSPEAPDGAELLLDAIRRRQELENVVAIAVTGSCGKTTTKDLIVAILGTRFSGSKNEDTKNCGSDICDTILATSPDDDFIVQELGAWGPGTLDAGINLFRPDIAVVSNVRNDHYSAFHGPGGAQVEKGKLVRCLPPRGTAVVNWDDPLVREMADWTQARTLSFGRSPGAQLLARDVSARWPQRLSFVATYEGESAFVRTQLVGEHLLGSALAALGVAVAFGMSLTEAADALAAIEPTTRRMSVVRRTDGVTIVRDDWKAPAESFPEVMTFMSGAIAARKLAVIGTISDYAGRSRRVYSGVAWNAMMVLDTVVFVGSRAADLWGVQDSESAEAQRDIRARVAAKVSQPPPPVPNDGEDGAQTFGKMFVVKTVHDAHTFLEGYLRPGDLMLVKGSGPVDHLERLILAREEAIACWLTACGRVYPCHMCDQLRNPPPTGLCEARRFKTSHGP